MKTVVVTVNSAKDITSFVCLSASATSRKKY